MTHRTSSQQYLQRVLNWNSFFSLFSGIVLIVAASPLASLMAPQLDTVLALSFPTFLRLLGLGVIGFAFAVWWVASHQDMPRWQVWTIASLDIDWVLGSLGVWLLAGEHLTLAGKLLIVDVALVVAVFGALELFGLLRQDKVAGLNLPLRAST